jgi:prolycopene isomerase
VVTLTSLVPYDIGAPWERERQRFADELVAAFDPVVPGLSRHLEILETATPLTMQRYGGSPDGATYGWENTPSQSASRRLSRVTPIPELFLAGHWTHPGTGSLRCIVSGLHTAMMMMEMRGQPVPRIEPETELPPWN